MRRSRRRRQVLAVAGHARLDALVVGLGRVLEAHAARAHAIDGAIDVVGAQRHVLDALALVVVQEFLDLRFVVLALVERNADLAVGAGHGLGEQAGDLALDVEVADLRGS